ncbi:hypothetical protein BDA99DRAFT_166824 [Phascolomyces articulosus]|uniref:Uncharacterized protein n=1 Tax=Phascolomyces articulosus TaxID=60185 RepID=A0AAD5PB47_9FUNG|nr:hypothetical protein BDA99DRAFT_166824 [Phascolomyces articulosus]
MIILPMKERRYHSNVVACLLLLEILLMKAGGMLYYGMKHGIVQSVVKVVFQVIIWKSLDKHTAIYIYTHHLFFVLNFQSSSSSSSYVVIIYILNYIFFYLSTFFLLFYFSFNVTKYKTL